MKTIGIFAAMVLMSSFFASAQDSKKVAADMNPKMTELREFNSYKECKWLMDTASFNAIVNYAANNMPEEVASRLTTILEKGPEYLKFHKPVTADRTWFAEGLSNLKSQLKNAVGKKASKISGNYILFFELMSKAYLFNEAMIATAGYKGDQPYATDLLNKSITEAGSQEVFDYLVKTFGCVPEKKMQDGKFLKNPDALFSNVAAILENGAHKYRRFYKDYSEMYITYKSEKTLMIDRPDGSHQKNDYEHIRKLEEEIKMLEKIMKITRMETMAFVYKYLCDELGVPPTGQTIQK
ncbi:MAG: hypothetical protein IK103_07945 [Bacteroidales bacterium]|nr:hypothetical protein [Bacteroidales bacterium]MBR6465832.1 hypothetical protein [Bacteroidales bacterium]